jgi:hypothetical protein
MTAAHLLELPATHLRELPADLHHRIVHHAGAHSIGGTADGTGRRSELKVGAPETPRTWAKVLGLVEQVSSWPVYRQYARL